MHLSFKKTPLDTDTNSLSVIMIKLGMLQLLHFTKIKKEISCS